MKFVPQAEAYAIKAKAAADAEQMAKKAEAWKEYGSAAMVDMMLETLPKVTNACAVTTILIAPISIICGCSIV